jgi:ArsR family transcriptional regulator
LREAGLVRDRRAGQWVYYRIDPALPGWIHSILASTVEGVAAEPLFAEDHRRLTDMPNRPGASCCA